MKFSEQWLREWVNPAISTEQLAHELTMAGLEVDAVEPVAGSFTEVVVGEIVEAVQHPDADKLRVCKVAVGQAEPLQIVCGAPNARVALRAPTAVIGAVLPGDFKIKRAKLRGVESFGMLCSAKELGLSDASEGLLELPADAPVGASLRDYLNLDDHTIELGLTPNRADCLGIMGIAREVAVLNRMALNAPAIADISAAHDATFPVTLDAPADCPRYAGRIVRGVNARAETPLWMQERLRRSGVRSLGPVVDVTNYVLLELGQPMHAFDLAKLNGGIHVRRAQSGETLKLLDGSEPKLETDTLVIADEKGPLALAGIMGGDDSAVTDDTVDIFFESAFFTPTSIAGRARRYGLHTDASHRYERGVSPELQRLALERATALLIAIAGGQPGPVVDVCAAEHLPQRAPIRLRRARIGRVLGATIADAEVQDILTRLGLTLETTDDGWLATPPAWRFDLGIEEDLIEELARVHGYDNIVTTAPVAPLAMTALPEGRVEEGALRRVLIERGYQEAITFSFVEPKLQALLDPENAPIALANPISADLAVMRTTLWASLIPAVLHNVRRQQTRVRLFETGLRFVRDGNQTVQEKMLAGVVLGSRQSEQWGAPTTPVDFYDVKGDVEALLRFIHPSASVNFEAAEHPALHPGQSARINVNERSVGWLGTLHPNVTKALDLPGRTLVFEMDLSIFRQGTVPKFSELSKFPAIRRDLAVVVDRELPAARLEAVVRQAAPETLQEFRIFDVYTGEGIDSRSKSVALGLTLQAHSRTLTDAEVDTAIENVVASLKQELGATLRD
jgi:phenylalanyl-tRNA synthetase beta chain